MPSRHCLKTVLFFAQLVGNVCNRYTKFFNSRIKKRSSARNALRNCHDNVYLKSRNAQRYVTFNFNHRNFPRHNLVSKPRGTDIRKTIFHSLETNNSRAYDTNSRNKFSNIIAHFIKNMYLFNTGKIKI